MNKIVSAIRQCDGKTKYKIRLQALIVCAEIEIRNKTDRPMHVYKCCICKQLHIGKVKNNVHIRRKQFLEQFEISLSSLVNTNG